MPTATQRREYQARYRAKYPNRLRKAAAEYRAANPGKHKELKQRWYRDNKEKSCESSRVSAMARKYGLTQEQWDELFLSQGRKCANVMCPRVQPTGKNWHVDHCHKTGKVRGILCGHCNTAIGFSGDSPSILRGLADYLERE